MTDFLQKEFYKNYGISPGHVIPVGIDPDSFPSPPATRDIDILGVGSLMPLKQYDLFIRLIKDLSKTQPGIKAVIRGSGTEESKLKSLIKELQLESNISILAEMPYAEVLQLMQRAKVFLHTANYEGFGTVCLEALNAGTHVLSFTRPMDQPIPHWSHAHNYEDMLAKAYKLLSEEPLDNSPVCPYDINDICNRIMSLYGL
jgi:glycosyltransferase involved in cell wall biosynthesis